ncbi:F0F1 ATP synthase subunit A [Chloroflexota bacterium]
MAKKGCLGCSFPVIISVALVFIALTVVGFLAGPIGQKLFPTVILPEWMSVPRPSPHLPAPVIFHIFGLPITNTIIGSWITVVFLTVISLAITRRMKIIPGRLQTAFEFLLGWMYDFCQGIAGEENGRRFFPVITTIFLFVLFNAWLSLIPGFGSLEISVHGHHYELLRGANTDVNTPLAIALVSFVFVEYYGLKALGIRYLRKFINVGQFLRSLGMIFTGKFKAGLSGLFSGFIDMFIGVLETLSEFIRIISFTFRLFGNMTAGEILLLIAAFLVPWVLALPFYTLELLVGFVQALIFSGLTLVFVTMAVTPHESESH